VVTRDPSEWVRAVVPAVFSRENSLPWTVYFDAETAINSSGSFIVSSGRGRKLAPPVVAALQELAADPALPVRTAAALSLFSNREKADLRLLAGMFEMAPETQTVAYRLSNLLQEAPVSWLREFDPGEVLALLDAVSAQTGEDDSRLAGLRKQLVSGARAKAEPVKVARRQSESQAAPPTARAPRDESSPAMETRVGEGTQRRAIFFRNPGCRDCERVAKMLRALHMEFTDLSVEEMDIRKPDAARLNEALCDRFGVPDKHRLTAPAVFCGAGCLIKGEITFERLGSLLSHAATMETAWQRVPVEALRRADVMLGERYTALSPWIILSAGLLDGINPCAFATIIFLLSYLQITRRGPREILIVGGAFVAGVFGAYFLLGLGLVEVVVRFELLQRLGTVFNWGLAAVVAGLALLNVWDGVLCLRGRVSDMVLQLPGALKARIHDTVRQSARHPHFVAAAFVAGLAIAALELACTGQVYAPTLLYMLKTGQNRMTAAGYLALYNAAFIVPLLVVFVGAYGGLRSERLTVWLQQRAAFVKFATAILFGLLFILFVYGKRMPL
jgi:cytochrome c biogenesis protein CcdA